MSAKLLTLFGGKKLVYIVRDQFLGTLAAGSVHGTATSDGKGLRYVVDAESKLTTSNALVIAGGKASPAYGDPGLWIKTPADGSWTFTPGDAVMLCLTLAQTNKTLQWGIDANLTVQASDPRVEFGNGSTINVYSPSLALASYTTARSCYMLVRCASSRHHVLQKVGTSWVLLAPHAAHSVVAAGHPVIANYQQSGSVHELSLLSLPANGDDRFATDTGLATSVDTSVAAADVGAHEATYWLELNNVTVPAADTIEVRASISGSDEIAVVIAADGSIALKENGTDRITGAAGQITNGAVVRVRRSAAASVALFDDNAQVGSTYASLAVPQGTSWKVESLGTGGAIGAVYAWPYNVTLRGAAGRL